MLKWHLAVAASALLVGLSQADCRREPGRTSPDSERRAKAVHDLQGRVEPAMYSDEEAARLGERAAAVVPPGKTRTRKDVLRALQIDPRRLSEHQVEQTDLGVIETYQLSESFDLTWAPAIQDPTLLDHDGGNVLGVRVRPRTPVSRDLEAVGLLSNQPLPPDGASPRR